MQSSIGEGQTQEAGKEEAHGGQPESGPAPGQAEAEPAQGRQADQACKSGLAQVDPGQPGTAAQAPKQTRLRRQEGCTFPLPLRALSQEASGDTEGGDEAGDEGGAEDGVEGGEAVAGEDLAGAVEDLEGRRRPRPLRQPKVLLVDELPEQFVLHWGW